ncbi:hypothetical protein O6H91_13G065100 [Diphasiastrum complanatum]|nr:hypothetical protein O6H91_13G065100 [Diphasiastrum complanatum]
MRNIKEATVFRYLFKCIENGYQIDWSELCIEAHFNLELGIAVIEGIKKATSKITSSTAASEDIIARINSVWEIKKKSERGLAQIKRCCAPEVTYIHIQILLLMLECEFSLEDVHTTLKFASLEQTEPYEEVENGSSGGTLEQRSIKKMLSEQGFLRWLHERDGASLVEIVTTFRDCDEAYLMHLLLTLEETNQIYRDKGLYRMTKTQYLGESCF